MSNALIFDFETLSQDVLTAPIVSIAWLTFDTKVFTQPDPYTFDDLCERAENVKFDVADQVNRHKKKIDTDTLDWWKRNDLLKYLKPTPNDLKLEDFPARFATAEPDRMKYVFVRGNAFDPVLMSEIYRICGLSAPYAWWKLRDTRSLLEGMMWGHEMSHSFIPDSVDKERFVAHDPVHDIVVDVLRVQQLAQVLA